MLNSVTTWILSTVRLSAAIFDWQIEHRSCFHRAARVLCSSVRPSVCLFVTYVISIKTAKHIIKHFATWRLHRFTSRTTNMANHSGTHRQWRHYIQEPRKKISDFIKYSRYIVYLILCQLLPNLFFIFNASQRNFVARLPRNAKRIPKTAFWRKILSYR